MPKRLPSVPPPRPSGRPSPLFTSLLTRAESRPKQPQLPDDDLRHFLPRHPGDDHLRASFESALIRDQLTVTAAFDISLRPPSRTAKKGKRSRHPLASSHNQRPSRTGLRSDNADPALAPGGVPRRPGRNARILAADAVHIHPKRKPVIDNNIRVPAPRVKPRPTPVITVSDSSDDEHHDVHDDVTLCETTTQKQSPSLLSRPHVDPPTPSRNDNIDRLRRGAASVASSPSRPAPRSLLTTPIPEPKSKAPSAIEKERSPKPTRISKTVSSPVKRLSDRPSRSSKRSDDVIDIDIVPVRVGHGAAARSKSDNAVELAEPGPKKNKAAMRPDDDDDDASWLSDAPLSSLPLPKTVEVEDQISPEVQTSSPGPITRSTAMLNSERSPSISTSNFKADTSRTTSRPAQSPSPLAKRREVSPPSTRNTPRKRKLDITPNRDLQSAETPRRKAPRTVETSNALATSVPLPNRIAKRNKDASTSENERITASRPGLRPSPRRARKVVEASVKPRSPKASNPLFAKKPQSKAVNETTPLRRVGGETTKPTAHGEVISVAKRDEAEGAQKTPDRVVSPLREKLAAGLRGTTKSNRTLFSRVSDSGASSKGDHRLFSPLAKKLRHRKEQNGLSTSSIPTTSPACERSPASSTANANQGLKKSTLSSMLASDQCVKRSPVLSQRKTSPVPKRSPERKRISELRISPRRMRDDLTKTPEKKGITKKRLVADPKKGTPVKHVPELRSSPRRHPGHSEKTQERGRAITGIPVPDLKGCKSSPAKSIVELRSSPRRTEDSIDKSKDRKRASDGKKTASAMIGKPLTVSRRSAEVRSSPRRRSSTETKLVDEKKTIHGRTKTPVPNCGAVNVQTNRAKDVKPSGSLATPKRDSILQPSRKRTADSPVPPMGTKRSSPEVSSPETRSMSARKTAKRAKLSPGFPSGTSADTPKTPRANETDSKRPSKKSSPAVVQKKSPSSKSSKGEAFATPAMTGGDNKGVKARIVEPQSHKVCLRLRQPRSSSHASPESQKIDPCKTEFQKAPKSTKIEVAQEGSSDAKTPKQKLGKCERLMKNKDSGQRTRTRISQRKRTDNQEPIVAHRLFTAMPGSSWPRLASRKWKSESDDDYIHIPKKEKGCNMNNERKNAPLTWPSSEKVKSRNSSSSRSHAKRARPSPKRRLLTTNSMAGTDCGDVPVEVESKRELEPAPSQPTSDTGKELHDSGKSGGKDGRISELGGEDVMDQEERRKRKSRRLERKEDNGDSTKAMNPSITDECTTDHVTNRSGCSDLKLLRQGGIALQLDEGGRISDAFDLQEVSKHVGDPEPAEQENGVLNNSGDEGCADLEFHFQSPDRNVVRARKFGSTVDCVKVDVLRGSLDYDEFKEVLPVLKDEDMLALCLQKLRGEGSDCKVSPDPDMDHMRAEDGDEYFVDMPDMSDHAETAKGGRVGSEGEETPSRR